MNLQTILRALSLRPAYLKLAMVGSGLAGLGLYRLLYATGLDGRGLLKSGHPAWIILCLMSLLAGGFAAVNAIRVKGAGGRPPHSLPACIACAAAAVSTLLSAISDLGNGSIIYAFAALLAVLSFGAVALCRLQGRRPNFLLHVVICIFFTLQMLKIYQTRSVDPQIQDYFFQLLACIALTTTAYQLAAFDLGRGQRRWLCLAALCAVYLCVVSLGSTSTCFYLTGAAWAFTAIPTPRRTRRPQTEEQTEHT